jgi:broad specificity phosphatase PhoE
MPLLEKLRHGGLLLFFRHAKTPNYAAADDNNLENCATQRNLSKEGREQAQAIGAAFRDLEIPVGIVRASPLCRTQDTAWLAFGHYERDDNMRLHGTNPAQDVEEAKIWRNLRNIAKILPLPGTNSVFISHGTVGEAFGGKYLDEGEAIIVEPDGQGAWHILAQVKSDQWVAH